MDFGQNLYNLLLSNAQPLVLTGLIIIGLVLLFKRKLTEFIGFVIVAIIAVGFVFNTSGTKDSLLKVYDGIFNSTAPDAESKKTGSVTDVRYYGTNGLILQEMGLLSETEVAFIENDGIKCRNGSGA